MGTVKYPPLRSKKPQPLFERVLDLVCKFGLIVLGVLLLLIVFADQIAGKTMDGDIAIIVFIFGIVLTVVGKIA